MPSGKPYSKKRVKSVVGKKKQKYKRRKKALESFGQKTLSKIY